MKGAWQSRLLQRTTPAETLCPDVTGKPVGRSIKCHLSRNEEGQQRAGARKEGKSVSRGNFPSSVTPGLTKTWAKKHQGTSRGHTIISVPAFRFAMNRTLRLFYGYSLSMYARQAVRVGKGKSLAHPMPHRHSGAAAPPSRLPSRPPSKPPSNPSLHPVAMSSKVQPSAKQPVKGKKNFRFVVR